MKIDWGLASFVVAVVAAVAAIIGLPVIYRQLQEAKGQRLDAIKLSGVQVLLAVDAVLADYQHISINLRPRGRWHESETHPDDDELRDTEPYLGVFERLWIAYTVGQIDMATIEHLYGYRIKNIWANPRLVKTKLQNNELREGWSMLIALTYALEAFAREKGKHYLDNGHLKGHTDTSFQPPEWTKHCAQIERIR
jgi:type II secretory pathway pseudopilin PulG